MLDRLSELSLLFRTAEVVNRWSAEADRLRRVALGRSTGEIVDAALLAEVERAVVDMGEMLEGLDGLLNLLPPGHADWPVALRQRGAMAALRESLENSLFGLAARQVRLGRDRPPPVLLQGGAIDR